jgi:hypothetical protein
MPKRTTDLRFPATAIAYVACAFLFAAWTAPAVAGGPVSGGVGVDYQTGADSQSYRGALLFGSLEGAPGDLTLAAIRYDDSRTGTGTAAFGNAGVKVVSPFRLRVIGLRAFGEGSFDASRLRAGPELNYSSATLGAYYLHVHDSSPANLDAGGAEVTVPLSPKFSCQVGAIAGRWSSGASTAQGILGGTLRAGSRLVLLGEVDIGRNATTSSGGGGMSGPGPLGGGLLGGLSGPSAPESGSTSRTDITTTAQLGLRFLIP